MNGPLVIVGDTLLDVDLRGHAGRLSPDAPVPVIDRLEEFERPGGAGLAALLAARDGADVVLITALGEDEGGERLRRLLGPTTVKTIPFYGPTPIKQRVLADGQSLLRLDSGGGGRLGEPSDELVDVLGAAGAVLVADYGHGITALDRVRRGLAGLSKRVPVVWDPHPRGAEPVPGVRLATPNQHEAEHFTSRFGDSAAGRGIAGIRRRAELLVRSWRAQAVSVTAGEGGALLSFGAGAPTVVSGRAARASDPCGAGDRFAVSAALALGAGAVTTEAVEIAVHDANDYVAGGGAATLDNPPEKFPHADKIAAEELAREVSARGGTVVATGGCFDLLHAGHVESLRAARQLGDCLVVCLNSDASVRRLKGPGRPLVPAADRARVLLELESVDAVVEFDEPTPVEVLRRIRPHVWAKGGDYSEQQLHESEVLAEWGGQAVILPYVSGRSTTRLVLKAADLREEKESSQ